VDVQPVRFDWETYYPDMRRFVVDEELTRADQAVVDAQAARDAAVHEGNGQRLSLTELQLEAANAKRESLRARIAAEEVKHGLATHADAASLAPAASQAERRAAVADAAVRQMVARQALDSAKQQATSAAEKEPTKSVADAEKELADAEKLAQEAQKKLAEESSDYSPLGSVYATTSTGRRLALARWITDRKNPLAARVAANHIWARHFGAPLVENVFDFGLRSEPTTRTALLDLLSTELMDGHWCMKRLHRQIVTSHTYRIASTPIGVAASNSSLDPDNKLLWRINRRRLEAEIVRDNLLHVAGNLDQRMGGPDIDHNQGQVSRRRSIYFRHAYEKQMKFLELFDGASVNECYRRGESIVPQQALAMANSQLSIEQSRRLAGSLAAEADRTRLPDDTFTRAAFQQVLGRPPSPEEIATCLQFVGQQAALLARPENLTTFEGGAPCDVPPAVDPHQRARENLVHVLMNHHDFVTIH
jgi:hypothetical protein